MISAGYDPKAMGEMFENMAKIRKLSGDNPLNSLLTHPITSSRIINAFNAADQLEITGGKKNTLNFELIKGKLKARYNSSSPQAAMRYFETMHQNNPSNYKYFCIYCFT